MSSTKDQLFSSSREFKNSLRKVQLTDLVLTPIQMRNNTYLRAKIITEGFRMTAYQSEIEDEDGSKIRILFYNFPLTGSVNSYSISTGDALQHFTCSPLSNGLLKVGTIVLIRDPWFKMAADGGLCIRVEDCKDIAFDVNDHGCFACGRDDLKLKKCGQCLGAFYCSSSCQKADWKNHRVICRSTGENDREHQPTSENTLFGTSPYDLIGRRMTLTGLKSQEYNGLHVTVSSLEADGRLAVMLLEARRVIKETRKLESRLAVRIMDKYYLIYVQFGRSN